MVTNNFGWKAGSLFVSYLLWLTLVAQPELSTVKSLPVVYKNLPPGTALASGAPETVHVELRGTHSSLAPSNLADAMVTLDLEGSTPQAAHTFTIVPTEIRLPQGVQFVRSDPAEVLVRLTALPAKPENRK